MPALPHPVLVADIGGTNARFAVVNEPGGRLQALPSSGTRDADQPDAATALAKALASTPHRPRSVALAVAGPVHGLTATLTNATWHFDGPALLSALGLETGVLLNDFEALAMAAPTLQPSDVLPVGQPVTADAAGPMLVLGPGTGFGAATVVRSGDRLLVLPGEAGHMECGPASAAEAGVWPYLQRVEGRITIEALLSGHGLGRLEAALLARDGRPAAVRDGVAVAAAAAAGDRPALDAVGLFATLLGRVAGDLALVVKATGGVLIAGGVMPKLWPFVDPDAMRAAFEAKAPMQGLMRQIPLGLIIVADPALRGLAAMAADPDRWGLGDRLWR